MKKLSMLFALLAVLLTNGMTAVVAYTYGVLKTGAGYSAPAGTAFLYAIPFAVGIGACIVSAVYFKKKAAK